MGRGATPDLVVQYERLTLLIGAMFPAEDSIAEKNSRSTIGPHRFGPGNTHGFKPGVCPNPGGRPKKQSEVVELARELSVDAVRALHRIATKGRSERARIEAAVALLDRAFGRPKVTVENEGNPLTITAIRQIIVSPEGETIRPASSATEPSSTSTAGRSSTRRCRGMTSDLDPGRYAVDLIRRVAAELLRERQQLNNPSSRPSGLARGSATTPRLQRRAGTSPGRREDESPSPPGAFSCRKERKS